MATTINKGLDKVKDSVTSTGDGINSANEYIGDKYTGTKESVKETSSSAYDKVGNTLNSVGDGFATVGDYIGDKYEGAKKVIHDGTAASE